MPVRSAQKAPGTRALKQGRQQGCGNSRKPKPWARPREATRDLPVTLADILFEQAVASELNSVS